ncbi:GNAT family N-acetyltransferase [Lactococcus lactis]|uniref:GNAT family N-acetyltransferase n=1 Tax=Lactococcus lactis TaxID=1358 RepID=UPI00071C8418|nr:GNAT family N-acetyltransferase [Lactococcus lactis]
MLPRQEPIAFEDLKFNTEEDFSRYLTEKKGSQEKLKDNFYYILTFDGIGPRVDVFEKSNQEYLRIAYIDSIYDKKFKNLYISILNVKPEYRNLGIGTSLYNYFEEISPQKFEVDTINGKLDPWIQHKERERFYSRLGFKLISEWDDGIIDVIQKQI